MLSVAERHTFRCSRMLPPVHSSMTRWMLPSSSKTSCDAAVRVSALPRNEILRQNMLLF